MITKDLIVNITNPSEGITLTFKTQPDGKVAVSGDFGVYNITELKDALELVENFSVIEESKRACLDDYKIQYMTPVSGE